MPEDLDAVVWVADDQVAAGLDYGVRLAERLEARGLRVGRTDLTQTDGRVPMARLHVLSGGGTSVTDKSGWMPRGLQLTRSLIDGASQGTHVLLGVCLGSQMIAEALWPGSVGDRGRIAAGLIEVVWRWPATAGEPLVVPAFHYHEVDRTRALREGASVVAENHRRGLQGFRYGERLWGVQFHPELTPDDLRRLVSYHARTIETHGNSPAEALSTVDKLESAWNPRLFDRILDQVASEGQLVRS